MTQYVGTRISAQVRSHAQKVLKDYSPKVNLTSEDNMEESGRGDLTSQFNNETLGLGHHDPRTVEPKIAVEGFEIRPRLGSNECLTNLN